MIFVLDTDNKTNADIIGLIEGTTGSILPRNDTNLQMIEANVVLEFDVNYGDQTFFDLSFDGNYTIYNSNDTTEILIGAPFYYVYFDARYETWLNLPEGV